MLASEEIDDIEGSITYNDYNPAKGVQVLMYEQDYIMRIMKEMIRALAQLLLNKVTESPMEVLRQDCENNTAWDELIGLLDQGRIAQAENRLFQMAEEGEHNILGVVLVFFDYLNNQSDDFLRDNAFSREELLEDFKTICGMLGYSGVVELL